MNKNHNNKSVDTNVNYAYLAGSLEGKLRSLAWNGELEKLESMDIEFRDAVISSWIDEMYKYASAYAVERGT